ncbi:MAG: hypothetical protein C4538_10105 [Nitrospiraceae bacterium]|nr:MAG: hypothetical protein C4538_10105 [Nitrospiraceae bacterium]
MHSRKQVSEEFSKQPFRDLKKLLKKKKKETNVKSAARSVQPPKPLHDEEVFREAILAKVSHNMFFSRTSAESFR